MNSESTDLSKQNSRIIDSPLKRYLFTLFSNLTIFVASFVTAGIVPRALGPKLYGDFGFLSRISTSFRRVLDMEASTAFFTRASKEEESGALVKAYASWLLIQLFAVLTIISLAFFLGLGNLFWPGQQFKFVLWIAAFDWVFFLAATLKSLADAKGFTVKAQLINLVISALNIVVLVTFALSGRLNLSMYVAIQILVSAILSLILVLKVILPHRDIYLAGALAGKLKELKIYFFKYCSPLVAYGLITFIFDYFDRLLLQRFSGSVQQGYFQIATSWAAPAALFTTSILSIYKREMTNSLSRQDSASARDTFSKYLKMMYFLALVFGVFLAFHASALLELIAGPEFKLAAPTLTIMAFYPAFQAYGQLGGAAFLASERTALLRNLGIAGLFISMAVTYFFVAPRTAVVPGLGLGSVGLALKSVIFSLLMVQLYLWYNCKFFKLKLFPFWWHQFYCLVILAGLMFLLKTGAGMILGGFQVIRPIVVFLVYLVIVGLGVYLFPGIASLKRSEIVLVMNKVKLKIIRIFFKERKEK